MPESREVLNALAAAAAQAREAGLIHVSDAVPGIRRRRAGKGFVYLDPSGARVRDAATLERIRALAIPPAYTEVWICPHARGHLQATGRDARRRKQYRYHPQWSEVRGNGKFTRIVAFGRALPRLRRRVRADLARPGHPREKVLAIVVALMGATLVRVGNAGYVRDNGSFGLTTLRNRHFEFASGGRVRLRFAGKGGQMHDIAVDDRRLVRLVRGCRQLPGQLLFQYRDDDGELHPVDSGAVNDYLREAMGEAFTAKDFRTWGGTLAAFQQLAATPLPARGGERALARVRQTVTEAVAGMLGNTVAVCRKAYIDPCVFEGWCDGRLARCAGDARGPRQWESAALRFLGRAHRDAARAASGGGKRKATKGK
ncbi:DNA topoisomerase IB [Pseudoxanthomonas sp. z9]|uniref:DNA topoisomerase IB n=1 Tax=Pseudoxanthomonas sp. z9 TaxID=2584942 RepID=UPI001144B6A1|nr:DNA topoisomerase IB [Pseudoxanthomonas sp. z9]